MPDYKCLDCKGIFEYPVDIKKYGEHRLCRDCIGKQTPCVVCNKRRFGKYHTELGDMCGACLHDKRMAPHGAWYCEVCDKYHFTTRCVEKVKLLAYGIPQKTICQTCFDQHPDKLPLPQPVAPCLYCGITCIEQELEGRPGFICVPCSEVLDIKLCALCGGAHVVEGRDNRVKGVGVVCNTCVVETGRCHYCADLHLNVNLQFVKHLGRDRKTCATCFAALGTCDECGEKGKLRKVPGVDKNLCTDCRVMCNQCEGCNNYAFDVVTHFCGDCRHERGKGIQRRYDYKPRVFTPMGNVDYMLLGVENEMSLARDTNKDTYLNHIAKQYHPNIAYTQYDGTIDYGTEVVFHPMTLAHAAEFPFDKLFTKHVRASNTTGMHVHLTKDKFTKLQLYKFMRFISTNTAFVELIAGRKSGQRRTWRFTKPDLLFDKVNGQPVDDDKYVDVNMLHPKTVELRIFKGAVKEVALRKNLEFAHALWAFTLHTSIVDLTPVNFCAYVDARKHRYVNLISFFDKHRLKVGGYQTTPILGDTTEMLETLQGAIEVPTTRNRLTIPQGILGGFPQPQPQHFNRGT